MKKEKQYLVWMILLYDKIFFLFQVIKAYITVDKIGKI